MLKKLLKKVILFNNYGKDYLSFKKRAVLQGDRFPLLWQDRYPCLKDKTSTTDFDHHYIYHTAWAARILAHNKPAMHIDISSSLYFNALVSAFIPIKFYDYRPANISLKGLTTEPADICSLPFADRSVQSLSCMHVVEHIGLGRYGDPLDPDGDLKAISELKRVLAIGGSLLFVVPVGKPRIMFNAHRIYSFDQVASYFKDMDMVELTLIPDNPDEGGLINHATKKMVDAQRYGCGCFWFRK
jgi:SAM-dependent methyltransferase